MVSLIYFNGKDNTPILNVRDNQGKPSDLTAITRIVGEFTGTDTSNNFTADTDATSGLFSWDSSGDINFNFEGLTIAEDTYSLKMTLYDAVNTLGQVIVDPCCGQYVTLKVCTVTAITIS